MGDARPIRIICLGTGTSHGIPMIACDCAVCRSTDSRDKRTRPSIVVDYGDRSILVDTTPELRLQCIACDIQRVDAVLFTHHHADHVCGLDDLRRFNWVMKRDLSCYATADTAGALRAMFRYAFDRDSTYPSATPKLKMNIIDDSPFELFSHSIVPIPMMHGTLPVLGFRFGTFAYCTDCSEIPESSIALLSDLDVLILDGLRRRPHPTHFNLEQAVEMAGRIRAGRTFFTHIAHELKHAETNASLPEGMALAYDGQVIDAKAF